MLTNDAFAIHLKCIWQSTLTWLSATLCHYSLGSILSCWPWWNTKRCGQRPCAEQLAGVLMDIFDLSVGQAAAPKCIKPPPLCLPKAKGWMDMSLRCSYLFLVSVWSNPNPGISENYAIVKDIVFTILISIRSCMNKNPHIAEVLNEGKKASSSETF